MAGTVWAKFYWSDWSSDPALRICSLAAQGLWMRMLCIAAEADPTGYVTVNGRPLGVTDIARLAGVTETECESLLAELDRNGVFSRDRKGTIYSRRMVRDEKRSQKNRENGKKGGNPSLGNANDNSGLDNPPDNPRVKGRVKTQRPETRNQIPEERDTEDIPRILRTVELVDEPSHRSLIAELRKRGGDNLTEFEKTFLGSVFSLKTISRKQRETLDAIAVKVREMPALQPEKPAVPWQQRLEYGRKFRQWHPSWGPLPNEPGCIVPADLVQPNDGFGWGAWKEQA